jgi:2-hydroxy-6-oxonona-2,4-dienedioate hydrolase
MGDEPYRSVWAELKDVAFTQAWVDAGGIRTRYAAAGPPDAPAVVMLHGTGGHWETWAANLGPLSQHFRCLALDMVGNGFTDKPAVDYEIPVYVEHLRAFMSALGVGRAAFFGTSLGAWVAARLAVDHPEQVERLVLNSPAGLIGTRSNMDRIRTERTAAVEDPTWESVRAIFVNLIAEERNRAPDLIALRRAIYLQPEMKATIGHILVLQDPDTRARNLLAESEWSAIRAPTLVVASGRDHNEYENTARRVQRLIPGAELLEMPWARHWPHFEQPEIFNPAALRFLRAE